MFPSAKMFFSKCEKMVFHTWLDQAPWVQKIPFTIALSWIFALGAQIIIPLPFNLVPLALNPLPLLLAVRFFGMHAVYAYGFYLIQGLSGLPFFISFQTGPAYLFGPTGGYTCGFGIAMLFLALGQKYTLDSRYLSLVLPIGCMIIYFGFGLFQLSFFTQKSLLLASGLYPFIPGDACKIAIIMILSRGGARQQRFL